MVRAQRQLISIIVPIYNEAPNIPLLYDSLRKHLRGMRYDFEYVFIDDGSQDYSAQVVQSLANRHKKVRLIEFSRNFGKEAAVSAGLHEAHGDAAIVLDADLQHPPSLIGDFIQKWQDGADVVVGIKRYSKHEGQFKKFSSNMFYKIMGMISHTPITPHASDYRLIDKQVLDAFRAFSERNRMTRGLIDWLGFRREYVNFQAPPRKYGERRYGWRALTQLAVRSFTTFSLVPLKLAGYLGIVILIVAGSLSAVAIVDQLFMNDPLGLGITGTAVLGLLLLFLIGIVLACLGLMSLYIAHIHDEVTNRPLYVIRRGHSLPNENDHEFSHATNEKESVEA
ncbi:MAG TPA: glycosyltransferase family 2 protein [Candidatus Saccharimonadales bacterium]|nr:glycosyltransferase family 2 protein [Candidatus Saccharimonadales bacterium]